MLVLELVALVPSFTVVLTVGRRLPSVAMHPNLAGGGWNGPGIGWGDPVEGQAPIGPTKSPPGVGGSGVAPYRTRSSSVSRIASTSGGTITRCTMFGQSSIGGAASSPSFEPRLCYFSRRGFRWANRSW